MADGVEAVLAHGALHRLELRRHPHAHPQPGGLLAGRPVRRSAHGASQRAAKRAATAARARSIRSAGASAPSSRASELISMSASPQGTIGAKSAGSRHTLSAKP